MRVRVCMCVHVRVCARVINSTARTHTDSPHGGRVHAHTSRSPIIRYQNSRHLTYLRSSAGKREEIINNHMPHVPPGVIPVGTDLCQLFCHYPSHACMILWHHWTLLEGGTNYDYSGVIPVGTDVCTSLCHRQLPHSSLCHRQLPHSVPYIFPKCFWCSPFDW